MIPPNNEEEYNNVVTMVKENCMGYSQRQFDDAKRACTVYYIVRAPLLEHFKFVAPTS